MFSSFIISLSSTLVFYKIGGHKIVGKYFILYKEHLMLSAGMHTGRGPKYFKIKKSQSYIYIDDTHFCHVYGIFVMFIAFIVMFIVFVQAELQIIFKSKG